MSAGCPLYKFTSLIDADEPLESPDSLTHGGEFMWGPHEAYTPITPTGRQGQSFYWPGTKGDESIKGSRTAEGFGHPYKARYIPL